MHTRKYRDLRAFSVSNWGLAYVLCLLGGYAQAATQIHQSDFTWGTYIIDQPGHYQLAENISFAPNSVKALSGAILDGTIPHELAEQLGLPLSPASITPADSGAPLATQFRRTPDNTPFTPGGPLAANYDPAAYGLGFFAAIVITANNVVLDLNGHTIEQSTEHALLQRFFSVIELAEQPFIPTQGPANFGDSIETANQVVIRNGTIGRSAHHGIHGNNNRNVVVSNVNFLDYEVAALALNGVQGLLVANVDATNRKDVPILGTFSAARFIAPYLHDLVRRNASTQLRVNGHWLSAEQALTDIRSAINTVYNDVIVHPATTAYPQIDPQAHPLEYGLFHNPKGLVDGNSYSFLVNNVGVAVNGFPTSNAPEKSRVVIFHNVRVRDQQAFINEVVALKGPAGAATDPIGAVWQLQNRHPDSNAFLTIKRTGDGDEYAGNIVANAQALVAKAIHLGDFADSSLDVSRNSITPQMIRWVEASSGFEHLANISAAGTEYLCNGDSMFHVNKGVIGYNLSAVDFALLSNASVLGLKNLGDPGSSLCGDYSDGLSHPKATLAGYGGAGARGYAIAGANWVSLRNARVNNLSAVAGNASAVDIITDSQNLSLNQLKVENLSAGLGADSEAGFSGFNGPNPIPTAVAVRVGVDTKGVKVKRLCTQDLQGYGGAQDLLDSSNKATVHGGCRNRGNR